MTDSVTTSAATVPMADDHIARARLLAEIAERRNDAGFMARLRKQIEQDSPLLARLDGSTLCLREVIVTCGTYAEPGVLDATHVLCLRQLPCDNPNHKPEVECYCNACRVQRGEWNERLARIATFGNIAPCPLGGSHR